MSRVRVPLHGKAGGFATVDPAATVGAIVGTNLYWPDGTVVVEADFIPAAATDPNGSVSRTMWSLVLEIPANVQAVAALATDGFVRKAGTAWSASPIVNADLSGASTTGLVEGSNLYYTQARADARVAAGIATHVAAADPHTQYILDSEKGVALGVAPLGSDAKIDTAYLPASVVGQVEYKGTWNASAGTAPSATPEKGWYYIVTVAGSTSLSGITDWNVGDWAIYSGTAWNKVDNTDAVSSVAGLTGVISGASLKTALSLGNVDNTADTSKPVSTAQQAAIDAKVIDSIADGDTTRAPSRNSVFDALALKQDAIPDSGWTAATLLNGWVAFGGTYAAPGYRKVGSIVYLRGVMKSGTGTAGTPLLNLPAGVRPAFAGSFTTPSPDSPTIDARVDVNTNGNIVIGSTLSTTTYLALDGIQFFID